MDRIGVDDIAEILKNLYTAKSWDEQMRANAALCRLQKPFEAWQMAFDCLSHETSEEIQFYGAGTIYAKLRDTWPDVKANPDFAESLKVNLFKAFTVLAKRGKRFRSVMNKLADDLALLVLVLSPDQWQQSVHFCLQIFNEAIDSVDEQDKLAVRRSAMSFLASLPEEFRKMGSERKSALRPVLEEAACRVLSIAESSLYLDDPSVREEMAQCLEKWAQFGLPVPQAQPLLQYLFKSVASLDDNVSSSVDLLLEILSHPNNERYPDAFAEIAQFVMQLHPMFAELKRNEQFDTCHGIARLVTHFIEANATFTTASAEGHDLICFLLDITAMPGHYPVDERSSDLAINAWNRIIERWMELSPEEKAKIVSTYGDVFPLLLETIHRKLLISPDYPSWDEDSKHNFDFYRAELGGVLSYLHELLGVWCLQEIGHRFSVVVAEQSATPWQSLEAIIFLLKSVSESIVDEESELLGTILALIPRIVFHEKIAFQLLLAIGSYSWWFAMHPEFLTDIVSVIVTCLLKTREASERLLRVEAAASLALVDVARECSTHLIPILPDLIRECLGFVDRLNGSSRIFETFCLIIDELPEEEASSYLEQIYTPRFDSLRALTMVENNKTNEHYRSVEKELELLTLMFRNMTQPHEKTVASLLIKIWPHFLALVRPWLFYPKPSELFTECMKVGIRATGDHFSPLVEPLCELVISSFCCHVTHPPYLLTAAASVVTAFGDYPQHVHILTHLYKECTAVGLAIFGDALEKNPGICKHFMTLTTTAIKSAPRMALNSSEDCHKLVQCAIAALPHPEKDVKHWASLYLKFFISATPGRPEASRIIEMSANDLMTTFLRSIGDSSTKSHLYHLRPVLTSMKRFFPELLASTMTALLKQPGFPSNHIKEEEKEAFLQELLKGGVSSHSIGNLIEEFNRKCSGWLSLS
ncbi:importin-13-like [Oscarella lobularis]|uniref:importin-13-like n=1 Tax=Oscarella lobularis TaxID=121494 RepID=UPI003313C148